MPSGCPPARAHNPQGGASRRALPIRSSKIRSADGAANNDTKGDSGVLPAYRRFLGWELREVFALM